MGKRLEIKEGDRFNRLTIIKEVEPHISSKGLSVRMVECICDCRTIKTICLSALRNGNTKSCGCLNSELTMKRNIEKTIHGDTRNSKHSYLWLCLKNIKDRCYNSNHKSFKNYGGRGIKIYEPWINNYIEFKEWILENLGERPKGYSLDRINNNKNYEPGNLRWATSKEQNNNRRRKNENRICNTNI